MSPSLTCLRTSSRYTAVKILRSRSPSRGSARAASMTPTGGASVVSAGQYPNRRESDPGGSCSTCSSILTRGGRGACSPRSHWATTVWLASTASARARRDMPESSRACFSASLNASSSGFAAIVSLSTPLGGLSMPHATVRRPDSPPAARTLRTVVCVPCQPSGKFVRLPPCDGCPTKGSSREGAAHGQQESTSLQVHTYLLPSEVAEVLQVSPKTVTRWAKEGKLASRRTLGGHRRYARADIESLAERLQEQISA